MKKKTASCLLALLVAVMMLFPTAGFAGVTDANTPAKANYGMLKWEKSLGTGYTNSPTPPFVDGNYIFTFANKIVYKINKGTGAIEASRSGISGTPGYAMNPVIGDGSGYIYVTSIDNNVTKVTKLREDDLSIEWVSAESFPGQNLTPLVYNNGHIYGGTWGDIKDQGTYFSLNASTGATKWKLSSEDNDGYYWDGAYATDDYVIFGTDGKRQTDRSYKSTLYSCRTDTTDINKEAEKIDTKIGIKGQIRSSIKCKGDYLYFTTNTGYLYQVRVDNSENGKGKFLDAKLISIGTSSVNSPVISDDGTRLFVGNDSGQVHIFDITGGKMEQLGSGKVPGSVKGEMMYSSSANCLYATYNASPGGIYFLKLNDAKTGFASVGNLYTPAHKQYCVSPLTADSDGNIFYKNDSGYIMAVTAGYDTSAPSITSAVSAGYNGITVKWTPKDNVSGYIV